MKNGFSLIEVLLTVSIFGLIVTALVGSILFGQEATMLSGNAFRGAFLADEGVEALRNMRDGSYTNLTNGTHGLGISGNEWVFSGTSDITDIFTRVLVLSAIDGRDVRRKSITETVTWQQNLQRTGTVTLEGRLTNWRRDFGNWSTASQEASIDLPGNANANGVAIYATATNTYAVIVRDASGDEELYVYDITTPSSPTSVGSLETGEDLYDVVISGNYALVATADNSQELKVINLSTPSSPTLTGSFDAAGNSDANAVSVNGNTVFIGRNQSTDPEIYSISISTPSSPSQLGTLDTTNTITELTLGQSNQYLYASSIDNAGELVIISVSTPPSMSISSTYDPSGNQDGTAITSFSTYALLGRDNGEVHVIQLSTPSSPSVISSSLALSAQINDFYMGVGDLYAFAALSTGASAVQIVDLSDLSSPSLLSSVASTANTNSIVYDFDLNRVVTASSNNSNEVYIIEPN